MVYWLHNGTHMTNNKYLIGANIKYAREVRGITQTELAYRVGKKREYISKLELNKIERPNIYLIIQLTEIFKCRSDFLLGLSEEFEIHTYADVMKDYLCELTKPQQEHCTMLVRNSATIFIENNRMENVKPVYSNRRKLEKFGSHLL